MCVRVVARLHQRLKSMFFEIFSSLRIPFRDPPLEIFFKKTLILAFETNSALSCQNNGLFPSFQLIVLWYAGTTIIDCFTRVTWQYVNYRVGTQSSYFLGDPIYLCQYLKDGCVHLRGDHRPLKSAKKVQCQEILKVAMRKNFLVRGPKGFLKCLITNVIPSRNIYIDITQISYSFLAHCVYQ